MLGDKWLTDKHVRAVNSLLSSQFPTLNGLQDPLQVAIPDKPYESASNNFIQVINITNSHWVCASNVICPPGVVEVYDSKPNFSIGSSALHEQVAKILKTSENSFQLNHVDVQRQRGPDDCGLFTIANATTLCFGKDPNCESYEQSELRGHLAKCFKLQEISMFPMADRPRRLPRGRILKRKRIDIFCTCRLPWNINDSNRGALVKCQTCKQWFHELCMDIDKNIIDYPALKYNCKLCLNI